jgi:hypothetical protein
MMVEILPMQTTNVKKKQWSDKKNFIYKHL